MRCKSIGSQLILLIGLAIIATVPAAADKLPVDFPSCTVCHGDNVDGTREMNAPRLAGQNKTYLKHQLQSFKKGTRGYDPADVHGSQMAASAALLSEVSIDRLASYISTLSPIYRQEKISGNISAGREFYRQNCADCHGFDAAGLEHLKTPNLKVLTAYDQKHQMELYANGLRGSEFKSDIYAKWMRSASKHFNNTSEADNVIAYIHSLR